MGLAEKQAQAKANAIAVAEIVYHYKLIAQAIGYDEDTIANWRNDDKAFSEQLEQGRNRFLQKNIKKARPEFLLERMERDVFAPPKQQLEHSGGENPIKALIEDWGAFKEGSDDGKDDGSVQGSSKKST